MTIQPTDKSATDAFILSLLFLASTNQKQDTKSMPKSVADWFTVKKDSENN